MNANNVASPELAVIEVSGLTRASFLTRATLATGAVYGLGSITPFVRRAVAQENNSDVEVLNFALTLEQLEHEFYDQAITQVKGLKGDTMSLVREIRDNEKEHVDALMQTIKDLGGTPGDKPQFDFGDAFANRQSFLETAQTLEDTGVAAYNGAAPEIKSMDVLAAAGSIVQIEARHAALIRMMRGEMPAPVAFEEAMQREQVLEAVQPFIKS